MKITILDIIALCLFLAGSIMIFGAMRLETFFACVKAFMLFQLLIVGLLLKIFIKERVNV